MPTDVLLSQAVADRVLSAKLSIRWMLTEIERSRRAGTAPLEILAALEKRAQTALSEVQNAKSLADHLYDLESAFDTARRFGVLKPTAHKRRRFQAAGLDVIAVIGDGPRNGHGESAG